MWYAAQICIGTDARQPGNVVHSMLYNLAQSIYQYNCPDLLSSDMV